MDAPQEKRSGSERQSKRIVKPDCGAFSATVTEA
jgi:hypothetical protein